MSTCSSNSKAVDFPEYYDCINGHSILKKEFRQPQRPSSYCRNNPKFVNNPLYECGPATRFRWTLKKEYKLTKEGLKRPPSAFIMWVNDHRSGL